VADLEKKQQHAENVMNQVKRIFRYHGKQFRPFARRADVRKHYEAVEAHLADADRSRDRAAEAVAECKRMSLDLAWSDAEAAYPLLEGSVVDTEGMRVITQENPGGVWDACPKSPGR